MSQKDWHLYYLNLAREVAKKSKDPSTKTGAVIVSTDNRILATGFNGFPRYMKDFPALYADREEKLRRIIHCEMNAVLFARQSVQNGTLYTWPFSSCSRCAVHMIQAGIERVVYPTLDADRAVRWAEDIARAQEYFTECGVEQVEVSPAEVEAFHV